MGSWSNEPSSVHASPRSCTRSSRSTSAPGSRSGARRSRSGRASACPAPRSATRWPRSRSSDTSPTRTRSAGRIPTDIGYRHYVDSLPAGGRLRDAQRRAIAELLRRGDPRPRGGPEGKRAAALAADAVRRSRGPAVGGGGADRSPGADRHGADHDGPRRRPARPRGQADPRPAGDARRSGAPRDRARGWRRSAG